MAENRRLLRITLAVAEDARSVDVEVFARDPEQTTLSFAIPDSIGNIPLHVLDTSVVGAAVDGVPSAPRTGTARHPWFGELRTVDLDTAGADCVLRYTVDAVDARTPRPRGPSYDLRHAAGGCAGAVVGFVALPWCAAGDWRVQLCWRLHPGQVGVSSRGADDLDWVGPLADLGFTFVLAGDPETYSDPEADFHVFAIGDQAYDTADAYSFCARVLQELRSTFPSPTASAYRLFIRPGVNVRDGGAATQNGFILETGTMPPTTAARKFMFAHEITHHFTGSLDGDQAEVGWFSEGLAEHYKLEIPRRLGIVTDEDVATEIGTMCLAYYGNPANRRSVAEIAGTYWSDPTVQNLAYNRGFMYFTDLASLLRKADGAPTLDDLVQRLRVGRAEGEGVGIEAWRTVVRQALGEEGDAHLDRMLAGDLLVPLADAFGARFRRVSGRLIRRSLGFNEMSLAPLRGEGSAATPQIIAGLVEGSAAQRAGIRDGDRVLSHQGVRASNLHSSPVMVPDDVVTLDLERAGQVLQISYSTVIDTVDEYHWEPVARDAVT
ncbi:MAG: hypothetical protein QM607_08195 [Microbacterium sp.]